MDLLILANRILLDNYHIVDNNNSINYCFSHNESNIKYMVNSLKKQNISNIHILGNDKSMSGVPEYIITKKHYNDESINVNEIPFNSNIINTLNESIFVVEYLVKKEYKNILITAPPFHLLRAAMTMISYIVKKKYDIKVYILPGICNNWNEYAVTHQGLNNLPMNELLDLEMKRIIEYSKKGDILPATKINKYMMERDLNI